MPAPRFFSVLLALITLAVIHLRTLGADLVYDNTLTGGTNAYYAASTVVEYGDEVILDEGNRVMSQFAFEYYGDFTPSGDETARLRVYKADGPLTSGGDRTPGTVLYDSGAFGIAAGYQTKTFSGLSVTVPTDLIWTIEFGGLNAVAKDQAGLIFRGKPSVGDSYDDIWQKNSGQWQLVRWTDGSVGLANFAARIITGVAGNTISIRREEGILVVEWTGLSILQVSNTANGPYTDLPAIRNHYEINPAAAGMKFWRLRD